jgi:hypothetical protein
MQIEQILIRLEDSVVNIQYRDNAGRGGIVAVDGKTIAAVATLIAEANKRVPTEERPDVTLVQQEIAELEYRLTQLKNLGMHLIPLLPTGSAFGVCPIIRERPSHCAICSRPNRLAGTTWGGCDGRGASVVRTVVRRRYGR